MQKYFFASSNNTSHSTYMILIFSFFRHFYFPCGCGNNVQKLQGSLSKAFGFGTISKSKRTESKLGNSTSPTPSYSSLSSENGLYASVGMIPPPLPCNGPPSMLSYHHQQQQSHYQRPHQLQPQQYNSFITPRSGSGSSSSPPPPPNHRVSAPPMDTNSTLPRSQHRRVKSISNIEALAVTP